MYKKFFFLLLPCLSLCGALCEPLEEGTLCPSPMQTPYNLRFSLGLLMQQIQISNTDICRLVKESDRTDLENLRATIPITINNTFQYPDFSLDPGLRLSIGYLSSHDDFECMANFEWLHSRGVFEEELFSTTLFPSYSGQLYYVKDLSTEPIAFQKVDSFLDVRYFLLDLVLNKGSYFSKEYSFTPYAGIKSTWLEYKNSQNFSKDQNTTEFSLPTGGSWQRNAHVHFWGVGPSAGIHANYFLLPGWSITSTFDAALLFGKRNLQTTSEFLGSTRSDTKDKMIGKANTSAFSPTFRSLLGLAYTEAILHDTQFLTFKVCFDGRIYFNQYPAVANSYDSGSVANEIVYPTYRPSIVANNPFAMLGLVAEILWSF